MQTRYCGLERKSGEVFHSYHSSLACFFVNYRFSAFDALPQYLDQLFRKDPQLGKDYHNLQVQLYAEYDRPRLIHFLRTSNNLALQKTLEECQQRNLYPEMVYLLGLS
jgi:hypothetical protein